MEINDQARASMLQVDVASPA